MTPEAERAIIQCNADLDRTVRIHRVDGGKNNAAVADFLADLSRLAPRITVHRSDDGDGPGIRIAPNILYQAVPSGEELAPFLAAVGAAAGRPMPVSGAWKSRIRQIDTPASVAVFIADGCPFCPVVVGSLLAIALASDRVRLRVVDAGAFSDEAASAGVQSVPTTILDNGIRWTGPVSTEEIVARLIDRDPANVSPESLKHLLKDGQAGQVADMMRNRGRLFPAIIDLAVDDKWPVRLGAMVVLESLAETDPDLAAGAAGPLWERFATADDTVRGDILYLMGEVAGPGTRRRLASAADGPLADEVREAAREALEKLATRPTATNGGMS